MRQLKRIIVSLVLVAQCAIAGMTLAPTLQTVSASVAPGSGCQGQAGGFFGLPTWYKYLSYGGNPCEVDFDVRNAQNYVRVAMAIFEILMRIAGMAALAFVMYGAFQFLTSQGEPDKYAAARETITNALIGLAIALFAVSIVNLIGAQI